MRGAFSVLLLAGLGVLFIRSLRSDRASVLEMEVVYGTARRREP